jgi:DNA-binding MarR family transcriptional regulator
MDPRVGQALKRVQAALRARMDEALSAHDLTTPQYAALSALEREPGLSNADLARRSFVTPQTMLKIVELLESAGLVSRSAHPVHGRVLRAELTDEGRARVAACRAEVAAVEARTTARLSPDEVEQLAELLGQCAVALERDR